ncbi:hypothetical protein [Prochlorococcus marinus]|uniref:hypothetical protein n=1 Tax=Prochlorococcus marinus TaxID=1219 RepID=UPI001ADAD9DE|nr:hypothetical protein [Prochlorococcus marinus]MBO8204166.1 hypothetical protein [Prochlorococcus marinus CUG1415]MBW3043467.1 hypothetical protein [Prochlorococcus marinus str. MU1415]
MSLGFLGTFLLNNFLRETYSTKKSELEKTIENFLNKEVDLGDYAGIRFLGIAIGNSKIIDKKNIDSEIKAKNIYVGIMPLRSFLNQKWIIKIKPENTEINIDRDFFKREKLYLSNKNISKSNLNYDLIFNLTNYSNFKLKGIGLDTKIKGDLIYKSADKQIIGNIKSNFEDRGKLVFKFNKKLNKDFLKFEFFSNGLKLGLSEYNVGNRQFLLKEGKFKSNFKFYKISNQAICKGGFSLNKLKLNTYGLQEDINSDSLNFGCEKNNLIANNLAFKYGSLISDFNLNIPLNQSVNKIDLKGTIKFENSSNPDVNLSGGIPYWFDKRGVNFGKLNSKFVLNRTKLDNLNIFKGRGISGFVTANGDFGGSINNPELLVKFNVDYPQYKNIKITEFWGGEINNKDDEYTINMNNRNTPVPSFLTIKYDSNIKLKKVNFSRLSRSKKGSNYGSLNMVRKGDKINWDAKNFPLNELQMAIGNDKFDRISGNINGTGFFSLSDSSYSGRLAWSLGEYRNIKFANSLFSFEVRDDNYYLNSSLYPNDGGIIEINNYSSNKEIYDISFENVSTDWTLLTIVDILDFDNNQISKNKKLEKIKNLNNNKNKISKNKTSGKLKTLNIDLNKKSLEEKVNFIKNYNAVNLYSGDKYNLKKLIKKFDGRYNAELLIDAKEKNNLKIKNAYLDGAIELNRNTSISKKEKISLRFNGGLMKGNGELNVDKIPLKTLNLLLDNPIDLNGTLNFNLEYDLDKNFLEIEEINSINTSINENKFKFSKGEIKVNDQIVTTNLKLKYDNSNIPIYLKGSIPIKNKPEKKDLKLTFGGDKQFIDIINFLSQDYFDFKKGDLFYTFKIRGSIEKPEISGRLNIIDSDVDILDTNLRNINSRVFWNSYEKDSKIINDIEIIEFEATDEDKGTISITGVLPLFIKDDLIEKKISLETKNLNLVSENFNYIYDSNLNVRGSILKPIFSGDITLRDGSYKLKNFNLASKENKIDWEELTWNYDDQIEIISDETPFSLVELRKIIPSYLHTFSFDNLKLKLGPNFRVEYLNIIKTQLSTKPPGTDLIINGKIKEDIDKKEFNLKEDDDKKCGSLSLQGRINLMNGIANLYTTPFKLNKNNDNHLAFASRSCLVPLVNFSLISKVPEPIRKINQNDKENDSSTDLSTNDNSRDFAAIGIGNTRLIRIEASYYGYLDELRSSNNIFLRSTPSYNRSQIIGLMSGNSANLINRTFISRINNADAFSERFQLSLYPALIENNDSLNNIYANDNLDLENSEGSISNIGQSSEEWITEIGFDITDKGWINFAIQTIPGRDDIPPQGILTLQHNEFFNENIDLEVTGSTDSKGDWKSQLQLFWRY